MTYKGKAFMRICERIEDKFYCMSGAGQFIDCRRQSVLRKKVLLVEA